MAWPLRGPNGGQDPAPACRAGPRLRRLDFVVRTERSLGRWNGSECPFRGSAEEGQRCRQSSGGHAGSGHGCEPVVAYTRAEVTDTDSPVVQAVELAVPGGRPRRGAAPVPLLLRPVLCMFLVVAAWAPGQRRRRQNAWQAGLPKSALYPQSPGPCWTHSKCSVHVSYMYE